MFWIECYVIIVVVGIWIENKVIGNISCFIKEECVDVDLLSSPVTYILHMDPPESVAKMEK